MRCGGRRGQQTGRHVHVLRVRPAVVDGGQHLPFGGAARREPPGPVARVTLLPNLRVLGPRLGPKLPAVRAALPAGAAEQLPNGNILAAGETLGPDDVIRGEGAVLDGWGMAEDNEISIAFDLNLDEELKREGRVHDLIHRVNSMRKASGLALTDRITVTLPADDADLVEWHEAWISRDVLAVGLQVGDVDEPEITRVDVSSAVPKNA